MPHLCQPMFTSCSISIWSLTMAFSCNWTLGKWGYHKKGRSPVQVKTLLVLEFRALSFTGRVGRINKDKLCLSSFTIPFLCENCGCQSMWINVIHTWQQFLAWNWGMCPFLMVLLRVLSWILWQAQYCGTAISYFHPFVMLVELLLGASWTAELYESIFFCLVYFVFVFLASHQRKEDGQ